MKELNRVHLNGLRAVEAVGRLGSLQKAADELGVSAGAISQHLQKTETRLDLAIFERSSRTLVPTSAGRAFLARLTTGFQILDEAVGTSRHHSETILTVSVAPVFAAKWLVPRLSAWSRLHPEIIVRLDASVQLVNLDTSDVDIAIRIGDGSWADVRKDYLLPQEVFPVCAPVLAERLKNPEDLFDAPIIRDANSTIGWNIWLSKFGLNEDSLPDGHTFTDAALCLDAAIAGQGVMLAWPTLAHYALSVGQLVSPFTDRASTGLGYYMVTSQTRAEPMKVRNFKRWLKNEIERDFS